MNIWSVPRLNRPPSRGVISKRKEGCTCEVVADLSDPLGGIWKEEVVRETFLPFEANEILDMPLHPIPLDNTFVWNHEKSGENSVKRDTVLLRYTRGNRRWSRFVGVPSLWKKIWSLNVPPKVRVFVWRLCSGALPTALGLRKRTKSISPLCSRRIAALKRIVFIWCGDVGVLGICGM